MRRGVLILGLGLGLAAQTLTVQAGDDFAKAMALVRSGEAAQAVVAFGDLARGGNAAAQLNLAILHTRGEGTPQDDSRAFYWAWRARLQGEPRAISLIEYLDKRIDDATTVRVADELKSDLSQLAKQGHVWALMAIGRVESQLRKPSNPQEALALYMLAAAFEVPKAALLRDAQEAEMSVSDRLSAQKKARRMFQDWCAKMSDAAKPVTCVSSS